MTDNADQDNQTFFIDTSDREYRLMCLASTASFLPDDHLANWLIDFTDMEKYEEAGIIKKEIESRK